MPNPENDEADVALKAKLLDAASKATWVRNYPGGPQGIMGAIKDAIHRKGAEKIALSYGLKHGEVPKGRHSITISAGPPKSDADFTNSYISNRYDILVEINFDLPIIAGKMFQENKDPDEMIDLGPVDIDLRPGYSYQSHLWIKKKDHEWEITMLSEPSRRKKDPVVKVVGRFSTKEAKIYLDDFGITFNPDQTD